MKKIISILLGWFGLQVSRKQPQIPQHDYWRNEQMFKGLQRVQNANININTVIDVGAAAGTWSLSAVELWPASNFLLFEPLAERNRELKALEKKYKNFHFIPAAAGKEKSTVSFYVSADLDGSGVITGIPGNENVRTVDVASIYDEITRLSLKGPYLVKLDTHGFEVPIIEGCERLMHDISLFIIECYGFQIAESSLLFWEMCGHMDRLGFRLYDIVDVMNRPGDGAFWQCDAFFLRKDNPVFSNNGYQ